MRQAHNRGMTLQQWMDANGVTDDALAVRAGVDRSTISRVRRGKIAPSLALAGTLNSITAGCVPMQSFLPREEAAA